MNRLCVAWTRERHRTGGRHRGDVHDYQCPDCKRFETQAENILRQRNDVSFAIKHYPFCPDCNPNLKANRHPNACWAARAAEAARILQGDEGLERMHNWLFKNSGSFTQASFSASLRQLGFDPTTFIKTMNHRRRSKRFDPMPSMGSNSASTSLR